MHRNEERVMLVQLLTAHDPAALEYLYQYAPRLERTLQRRFGTMIDHEDLKDIVRDALLRALRTGERFDPQTALLTTWLNTLAHYEALSFLRTHTNLIAQTIRVELVDQSVGERAQQHGDDQAPSGMMQQVLQELPAQQATMVRQHYYEARSYTEIAQLHHVHEATVKSQLSRARSSLRKRLREGVM